MGEGLAWILLASLLPDSSGMLLNRLSPEGSQEARANVSRNKACYDLDRGDVESCNNQKLTFLHIPKNAGTTIEDISNQYGVKWGKNLDWDGCNLGHGQCWARWHEPPALLQTRSPYVTSTVFCVVRNPLDRIVSEYRYIYENAQFRWENADILLEYGCSADGLNAWVNRSLSKFQEGETYLQLCHMMPQSYYIWGPPDEQGNQCRYCHEILRLEDLTNSFNELMRRYDQPVRMEPHHHSNLGGCQNLKKDALNALSLQLIARVYERDFTLLNYSNACPTG